MEGYSVIRKQEIWLRAEKYKDIVEGRTVKYRSETGVKYGLYELRTL